MTVINAFARNRLDAIIRAAKDGRLALMECTEIATGEPRAVLCAVQKGEGDAIDMVPFGHICLQNPYDVYKPPE
jgi:hypothetical protein